MVIMVGSFGFKMFRMPVLWIIGIWLLSYQISISQAAGILEIRLLSFANEESKDANGTCCASRLGIQNPDQKCQQLCTPYFRICLKQWENPIQPEAPCYFGTKTTPAFGRGILKLDFTRIKDHGDPMRFPFSFNWPGAMSIIIEAWHASPNATNMQSSLKDKQLLIRIAELRQLKVNSEWTFESHSNDYTRLDFKYRVVCAEHYYGQDCGRYCRPRDDQYGHHVCTSDGRKQCMVGWAGPLCNQAICKQGCHPENGHCSVPGECQCSLGYQGELCDKCVRYPGCIHGTCQRAFECQCHEGWGGLFCNQDLNFCTHHKPCQNGATCTNTGSGHYTCTCPPGLTGINCEIRLQSCSHNPCKNGGTCKQMNSSYLCECPLGYHGRHCQSSARNCNDRPCENGGSCLDMKNGYQCLCRSGYYGEICDMEKDGCFGNPCLNGATCISKRIAGVQSFTCACPTGFTGPYCEIDINDCSIHPCLNGGSCIDQIGSFQCKCPPGFMGLLCQHNIDDCLKRPCANGGTCIDLINDFRCMCKPGFRGKDCAIYMNECESNPCKNGATCVDLEDGYQCLCPDCFIGLNCQQKIDNCIVSTPVITQTSAPNSALIVGLPILVIIVLILFILITVLIILYRRSKRPQVSQQSNVINNRLQSIGRYKESSDMLALAQSPKAKKNRNLAQPNYCKVISIEKLNFKDRMKSDYAELDSPTSEMILEKLRKDSELGRPNEDSRTLDDVNIAQSGQSRLDCPVPRQYHSHSHRSICTDHRSVPISHV